MASRPSVDSTKFPPHLVHPIAPLDLAKQIPKKSDQRQMGPCQHYGTYAAGLALECAGVKDDTEILRYMDMIVATGGGERDVALDDAILSNLRGDASPFSLLNERLMNGLRPTMFLSQLPNLLAGNISVVHGVTGSSRTFMGEESAGIDAVRIAFARLTTGQSDIILVGGSQNCDRQDLLMLYEFGSHNLKGRFLPVWERRLVGGGLALGSMGVFLVMEVRCHAEARGAKPLARVSAVAADRSTRRPGAVAGCLHRMWEGIAHLLQPEGYAVISGASGVEPSTTEERDFLLALGEIPVRATGTFIGHGVEAQFPMNVALAVVALQHGTLFPPCDASGIEHPMVGRLSQTIVTGVGHFRGEGIALVERV